MLLLMFFVCLPFYIVAVVLKFILNIPNLIIYNLLNFTVIFILLVLLNLVFEQYFKKTLPVRLRALAVIAILALTASIASLLPWVNEKPVIVDKKDFGYFRMAKAQPIFNEYVTNSIIMPNGQVLINRDFTGNTPITEVFDPSAEKFYRLNTPPGLRFFDKTMRLLDNTFLVGINQQNKLIGYNPITLQLSALNYTLPLAKLEKLFLLKDNRLLVMGWHPEKRMLQNPLGEDLKYFLPLSNLSPEHYKAFKTDSVIAFLLINLNTLTTQPVNNIAFSDTMGVFEYGDEDYVFSTQTLCHNCATQAYFIKNIYPKTKIKYPVIRQSLSAANDKSLRYINNNEAPEISEAFFNTLFNKIKNSKPLLNYILLMNEQQNTVEIKIVNLKTHQDFVLPLNATIESQMKNITSETGSNTMCTALTTTNNVTGTVRTPRPAFQKLSNEEKVNLIKCALKANKYQTNDNFIYLQNGRYKFKTGFTKTCQGIDCGFFGDVLSFGQKMDSHAHTHIYDTVTKETVLAPDSLIKATPSKMIELLDGRVLIITDGTAQLYIPGQRIRGTEKRWPHTSRRSPPSP